MTTTSDPLPQPKAFVLAHYHYPAGASDRTSYAKRIDLWAYLLKLDKTAFTDEQRTLLDAYRKTDSPADWCDEYNRAARRIPGEKLELWQKVTIDAEPSA